MSTALAPRAVLDACSHLASPPSPGVAHPLRCAASHVRSHSVPTLGPTLVCTPCNIAAAVPSPAAGSAMGDTSSSAGTRSRAVAAALSCLCISTSSPPRRPRTSSFSVSAAFTAAARLRSRSRNRTRKRCRCRKRHDISAGKLCRTSSSSSSSSLSCAIFNVDVDGNVDRNVDRNVVNARVIGAGGHDNDVDIDVVDDLPPSSTSSEATLSPLMNGKLPRALNQPSDISTLSPQRVNLAHDLSAFAETVSDVASSGSASHSYGPFQVGAGEGDGMMKIVYSDDNDDAGNDEKEDASGEDERNRFVHRPVYEKEDDDNAEMTFSPGARLDAFRDDADAPEDLDDLFDECDDDTLHDSWAPAHFDSGNNEEDPFSSAADFIPPDAPIHCDLSMFSVGSALEAEWRADGHDHNRRAGPTDVSPPTDIRMLVPLFLEQRPC